MYHVQNFHVKHDWRGNFILENAHVVAPGENAHVLNHPSQSSYFNDHLLMTMVAIIQALYGHSAPRLTIS